MRTQAQGPTLFTKIGSNLQKQALPVSVVRTYQLVPALFKNGKQRSLPNIEVCVEGRIGQDFIVVDVKTGQIIKAFMFGANASYETQVAANAQANAFANSLGRVWADFGEINVFEPATRRWWSRWVSDADEPDKLDFDAMAIEFGLQP